MSSPTIFSVRSTLFDRDRLLTIDPGYLSFDDKDLVSAGPTSITKANIESFRFGIDWIRGYYFIIGRSYRIEVRDHEGCVIRIRLRSLYGVRAKKLGEKYKKIYKALHDAYFNDLGVHYVKLAGGGLAFTLAGVIIDPEGIIDPRMGKLSWSSIGLKAYNTYFAIYDRVDPNKYRAFDYGIEWNAVLLYLVLDYILEKRNEM